MFLPQELIRKKRDNEVLSSEEITQFVRGITTGEVVESQIAALGMAVYFNGLSMEENVNLTLAMRDSGRCMHWHDLALPGPVLDKHSTGGVGDVVSLMLGPMVAACGGFVPMISGRGLGHTGGTLDKLSAIPGYNPFPTPDTFRQWVKEIGVAIIGQTDDLAPADRRFYATRDVTATVESIPLITASILAKKLAAGLDSLVMDVKTGNGAFMPTLEQSIALAQRIVEVGIGAGMATRAVVTDMNQPLATTAGNALETLEAVHYLTGAFRAERLHQVTLSLGAQMLLAGKLCNSEQEARDRLQEALDSGRAAEVFARMVASMGGPVDFIERPHDYLGAAPLVRPVCAEQEGWVSAMDTRGLGLAVCALGGGRRHSSDALDYRVGLSHFVEQGQWVTLSTPLAVIHAADEGRWQEAAHRVRCAITVSDQCPQSNPLIYHVI